MSQASEAKLNLRNLERRALERSLRIEALAKKLVKWIDEGGSPAAWPVSSGYEELKELLNMKPAREQVVEPLSAEEAIKAELQRERSLPPLMTSSGYQSGLSFALRAIDAARTASVAGLDRESDGEDVAAAFHEAMVLRGWTCTGTHAVSEGLCQNMAALVAMDDNLGATILASLSAPSIEQEPGACAYECPFTEEAHREDERIGHDFEPRAAHQRYQDEQAQIGLTNMARLAVQTGTYDLMPEQEPGEALRAAAEATIAAFHGGYRSETQRLVAIGKTIAALRAALEANTGDGAMNLQLVLDHDFNHGTNEGGFHEVVLPSFLERNVQTGDSVIVSDRDADLRVLGRVRCLVAVIEEVSADPQ